MVITINKLKLVFLAAIFLTAAFFFSLDFRVQAAGSIYYVSTSGNDSSGNGSQANPWRTISKGVNSMSGGDTLRISAGTYSERVTVPNSKSGTSGAPTIIEKYGSGEVKITARTDQGKVLTVRSSNTVVRNITVDGTAPSHNANDTCLLVMPDGNYNISNITIDNVKVQKCEGQGLELRGDYLGGAPRYVSGIVKNSDIQSSSLYTLSNPNMGSGWQSGLKIARYGKDIVLENNNVSNNWGEGIAVTRGENIVVRGNTVANNFSVNIYLDNSINVDVYQNFTYCLDTSDGNAILRSGATANSIVIGEENYNYETPNWGNRLTDIDIYNNIAYNCSRGLAWYGTDNGSGGLDNSLIANNTFYTTGNSTSSVYLGGESGDDIEFKNNLMIETGSGGAIYLEDAGGDYDFDYNYWVGNQPYQSQVMGSNDINGSLSAVRFTGTPGYNPDTFKVNANSGVVNQGVNLTAKGVTFDYYGGSRSGSFDIGAHEYGSAPASSSSSTSSSTSSSSSSQETLVCKADYDDSGNVDVADFSIFALNYNQNGINCSLDLAGGNCYLDTADLSAFVSVYKQGSCE